MAGRGLAAAAAVYALLGVLVSLAAPAAAAGRGYLWASTVTMMVPAVARTPAGYAGVMSNLSVTVAWPGSGVVYVAADPLTELDTQAAARVAAIVGSLLAGYDYRGFDFFFRLEAGSPIVGGPSASAAMAVAVMAALRGREIPSSFSMTGMVEPDAVVGPVGGVPEKLGAAAEAGVRLFAVPAGQMVALSLSTGGYVNLSALGEELGVRVVEAPTVLDAYIYATNDTAAEPPVMNWSYPSWLAEALNNSIQLYAAEARGNISCARGVAGELPRALRGPLEQLVAEAEASLGEAKGLAARGMLYSAASRSFYAAILATQACIAAKALASPDPVANITAAAGELLDAAQRLYGHAETVLRGMLSSEGSVSDTGLQLAVAVLLRVQGARDAANATRGLLEALQRSPSLDLLLSAAGEASYSYYRGLTAEQWLQTLLGSRGHGEPLDPGRLAETVRQYIYLAYTEAGYAQALGVDTGDAMTLVERAKALLERGNTTLDAIDALTLAVKGYTEATTRLREAFNTGPAAADAAARALKLLSSIAGEAGYTPLLPMLYLEYSSALNSTTQRLALLTQGASYALLLALAAPHPAQPPGAAETSQGSGQGGAEAATVTRTATETVTVTSTVPGAAATVTSTVTVTETVTGTAAGQAPGPSAAETLAAAIVAFAAGAATAALLARRAGPSQGPQP